MAAIEKIYSDLDLGDFSNVKSDLNNYIQSIADYQKNRYDPLPLSQKKNINDAWSHIIGELEYEVDDKL